MFAFFLELRKKMPEKYLEKIKKAIISRKIKMIFIWGAGMIGKMLAYMLLSMSIKCELVDSSANVQGRVVACGKKVMPPNVINPVVGNIVLIANSRDTETMLQQGEMMGLKRYINLFDFTDWCMYIAYLKYSKLLVSDSCMRDSEKDSV